MSPRSAPRMLRAVALLLALGAVSFAAAAPPVSHRHANHFPPGPGSALAERSCLICHSAMLVSQQHKDAAGWEKTVHQMELWGAPVPAAAHDSLIAYLVARFGAVRLRDGRPEPRRP